MPPPMVTDKARVKSVDLGRGDDFGRPMCAEWADDVGNKRCLQRSQVVRNRLPADLTLGRELIGLEDPAAASHEQLGEFLERIAALQAEELLYIFRPIGIHPFLE